MSSKKHKHERRRALAEARDAHRRDARRKAAERSSRAEARIRDSAARRPPTLVEVCARPILLAERTGRAARVVPLVHQILALSHQRRARLRAVVAHVEKVVPRLALTEHLGVFLALSGQRWIRPLLDLTRPRGRGRPRQLRSVIDHLLVRYAVPHFLYGAFDTEADRARWVPLFAHLGAGGSARAALREGLFPVPLTRRGCHLFLSSSARCHVVEAARRAQVSALEGGRRLADALVASPLGRGTCGDQEAFWDTVIGWLVRQPMLDPALVGPLVDYLVHRREEDEGFAMKGRSVAALQRRMEAWHGELRQQRRVQRNVLPGSGFPGGRWVFRRRTGQRVWQIVEILCTRELAEEGRRMRHCVLSYGPRIVRGAVSIWSLTRDGERMLTVEVCNRTARIVQARGRCNRAPTVVERSLLARWADGADLSLAV